jgi:hypothetical protein
MLHPLFTIDPGFDQEIQELEEYLAPAKPIEPLQWNWITTEPKIERLLVSSPGIAGQLCFELPQLELVGVLPLESSHLKLSRPGQQKVKITDKGVGLYRSNGYHVLLTGKRLDLGYIPLVANAAIHLVTSKTICSVLDISPGMPNDERKLHEFSSINTIEDGFETLTGFSASLLSKAKVRGFDCVVYQLLQNAVVSTTMHVAFEKLNQRLGTQLVMEQKLVDKLLLTPTTTSSMFL